MSTSTTARRFGARRVAGPVLVAVGLVLIATGVLVVSTAGGGETARGSGWVGAGGGAIFVGGVWCFAVSIFAVSELARRNADHRRATQTLCVNVPPLIVTVVLIAVSAVM